MVKDQFSFKPLKIKPIKIKPVKLAKVTMWGKTSSREPVPGKIKRNVKERARYTCEYSGCDYKEDLQFHHINMKNWDNRASNIELLCPNHHKKRHNKKIRKVISENILTGEKKTRLVTKSKNKKPKKKTSNPWGISFKPTKIKPIKWSL